MANPFGQAREQTIVRACLACCVVLVVALAGCGQAQPDVSRPRAAVAGGPAADVIATFSIVAVEPDSGICGAAVASKYPAVSKVVPYVRGGVGAFCTQHYHRPDFGPRALALMEQGKTPADILAELVRDDTRAGERQLAIVDARGRAAQLNPHEAPEQSRWWGAISGRFYACQGNTLAGREVLTAMAEAYENGAGTLADRLIAALVAGDRAGGDHRGRLAAGIIVDVPPRGEEERNGAWFELHVERSDDAVNELADNYAALSHEAKGTVNAAGEP